MDSNRSRLCSNDDANGEKKRRSKLTAKALENKISIQAERKAKVNKIKISVRMIKELMQTENNAPIIQSHLDGMSVLLEDASQLHNTVILMLPVDEQEKQNTWFLSVHTHSSGFMEDVTWRS